jgi:hypothetical protein
MRKPGRTLRFEALENRTLLTATVTGTINSYYLYLTGDSSDSIVVTQAGTATYKVQGIGTYIKNAASGKAALSQTYSGIEGIIINLPNGNNFVRVSGVSIGLALDITTGNGNDTIQVINVSLVGYQTGYGGITIEAGNGTNAVALSNVSAVGLYGFVTVRGGNGSDAVSEYKVNASMIEVYTYGGTDTVALNSVTARAAGIGLLYVDVGSGNIDAVAVVDSSADTADFLDTGGTNGTISAALNSFSSTNLTNFKYRYGI